MLFEPLLHYEHIISFDILRFNYLIIILLLHKTACYLVETADEYLKSNIHQEIKALKWFARLAWEKFIYSVPLNKLPWMSSLSPFFNNLVLYTLGKIQAWRLFRNISIIRYKHTKSFWCQSLVFSLELWFFVCLEQSCLSHI